MILSKGVENVTEEELEMIGKIELPDEHKFTQEVRDKIEQVRERLEKKEKVGVKVGVKVETKAQTKAETEPTTKSTLSTSQNKNQFKRDNNHKKYWPGK